jgi:hypothetical protein
MLAHSRYASSFLGALLAGAALLTGCDGPALPSLVKDEPVCEPYSLGPTAMKGGLRHPIRLRVLDGDSAVATVMLSGVPKAGPPTRFLLPDSNVEYTLEWTQCSDERAPAALTASADKLRGEASTHYECGDAKPYATVKFSTKKGDASTHELPMAPPPDPSCWSGGSGAPAPTASASASAAPSADAPADGPAPEDSAAASASASAAPEASASAAPAASASAAPTASASAAPAKKP